MTTLNTFIQKRLEVLAIVIRKIKEIKIENKKAKLSLFASDIILYVKI